MIELKKFKVEDIKKLISSITSKEICLQWAGPNYSYPLTEKHCSYFMQKNNNTSIVSQLDFHDAPF